MLWNAWDLRGYALHATDGVFGTVADFLFDDETWQLRYAVVDTGRWLPGRQVLIAPPSLGRPERASKSIPVSLTRRQIEDSPPLDSDQPLSRRMEAQLHQWYGWAPYFGGHSYDNPGELVPGIIPPVEDLLADQPLPHLRSLAEIRGYRLLAADGEAGTVRDFTIDDEGWAVRFLVVHAGGWVGSREVRLAVERVQDIRWSEEVVAVTATRRQIDSGPDAAREP